MAGNRFQTGKIHVAGRNGDAACGIQADDDIVGWNARKLNVTCSWCLHLIKLVEENASNVKEVR